MPSQPPPGPNPPYPFPCGGVGEQPCPPEPAIPLYAREEAIMDKPTTIWQGAGAYSREQMLAYGRACYDKGVADRAQKEVQ